MKGTQIKTNKSRRIHVFEIPFTKSYRNPSEKCKDQFINISP